MRKKNSGDDEHRNNEQIVPLTIATSRFAAEIYVAELNAHGVKAHLSSDDASGWRAGGQVEGYRIMVFEGDLEAGREILTEIGEVEAEELPAEE